MGNFSGERKMCTSENSLQKLSKNPTNTNALKLKKAQNELASIYLKEQTEYIQNQIDKICIGKVWVVINRLLIIWKVAAPTLR